jgi:hypothetical protein
MARAIQASHAGSALIGNSDPARNQGKIATTGVSPTYSSWEGIRLLGRDPVGQDLGHTVHEHGEREHGADEPADATGGGVERAAAQPSSGHQRPDLQQAHRNGDGHVAEHDRGAGDGRGEQFAPRAARPVDDDADPGEGAGKRDEQADSTDDDEGSVVDTAAASGDQLSQGRGDNKGE